MVHLFLFLWGGEIHVWSLCTLWQFVSIAKESKTYCSCFSFNHVIYMNSAWIITFVNSCIACFSFVFQRVSLVLSLISWAMLAYLNPLSCLLDCTVCLLACLLSSLLAIFLYCLLNLAAFLFAGMPACLLAGLPHCQRASVACLLACLLSSHLLGFFFLIYYSFDFKRANFK